MIFPRKIGAGDRGRTGDVQLGNFLLKMMFSILRAQTYLRFYSLKIFFLGVAISTSFNPSTFVMGTFWARGLALGFDRVEKIAETTDVKRLRHFYGGPDWKPVHQQLEHESVVTRSHCRAARRHPRNRQGFLKARQTKRSPTAVPPASWMKALVEQLPSERYPAVNRERC